MKALINKIKTMLNIGTPAAEEACGCEDGGCECGGNCGCGGHC